MNNNTIVNYSKFKESDRRIYSIAGYSLPGGVDVKFLIVGFIYLIIINAILFPITRHFGIKYFDFANSKYTLGLLAIILPFFLAFFTCQWKIQNYTIFEYIFQSIIYFIKPKNTSLKSTSNESEEILGFYMEEIL